MSSGTETINNKYKNIAGLQYEQWISAQRQKVDNENFYANCSKLLPPRSLNNRHHRTQDRQTRSHLSGVLALSYKAMTTPAVRYSSVSTGI